MRNTIVTLEPASEENMDLLVRWTLDPVAQGPYKRVPPMSAAELRRLFLNSPDRRYFLIRRSEDGKPLGRFYYWAWRFHADPQRVDWELNILIADPSDRRQGYGTEAQKLAAEFLLGLPETHTVFAYTMAENLGERGALLKAGFQEVGPECEAEPPSDYYKANLPSEECVLYVKKHGE